MSYRWTKRDDAYLRKHWRKGVEARTAIARTLNRTPGAVQTRGGRLGLATLQKPWTEPERDVVLAHYGRGMTAREITGLLPGRTRNAVLGEAYRLRCLTGAPPRLQPSTRGEPAPRTTYQPSLPKLRCMEGATAYV